MNATTRKIDTKMNPEDDPAMAAFTKGTNRLQSLLGEIRKDNPISKPDRPHPPTSELRAATSLDTQREELQRAVTGEQPEPRDGAQVQSEERSQPANAPDVQSLALEHSAPASDVLASEPPAAPRPETLSPANPYQEPSAVAEPGSITEPGASQPVNDAEAHAAPLATQRRVRGRPRVSDERKNGASYTLSPHIADRIRDLAALEQIRLKRTISASAIVEALIEIAEQHVRNNHVLKN